MNILVLNAGSSSLKWQLLDSRTEVVLARGIAERIGEDGSSHSYTLGSGAGAEKAKKRSVAQPLARHDEAIVALLAALTDPQEGLLSSLADIVAVGHRVVHGGDYFSASVVVDDEVLATLDEISPLAPLHNPAAVSCIRAARKHLPHATHVAAFDTAFHQTIPAAAHRYPIPLALYDKYKIRRYGFHGNSHRYVSSRAAELLRVPLRDLKLISCHLGNGSSICAIKDAVSVDTSMGFTPLDGLMMGTRSGSIDPAIVTFLQRHEGYTPDEVDEVLNKQSGLLGASGVSNDLRDVLNAQEEGNEQARLAREMYAYSIKKFIGQYMAAMGGVDVIVVTAGVGENSPIMRRAAFEGLERFGIAVDPWRNIEGDKGSGHGEAAGLHGAGPGEFKFSPQGSRVKLLVIPTNEELMIAHDAKSLLVM
ncbi:MAG: acetate kinase [Actinomycetes bacterium]|jgi:acetate kinase|nr:acetate kinase [Actinomycetes bacterium]